MKNERVALGAVENKKRLIGQLIVLVSMVATLGSLYFSEIRLFVPCELCWYQRILMYPIVLVGLVGLLTKDKLLGYYTFVLSGIGVGVSTYHYIIQKVSLLGDSVVCTGEASCTIQYINWMGFITIPFLSLIAFTIIFILSIIHIRVK